MRVGLVGTHGTGPAGGPREPDDVEPLASALSGRGVDVVVYACRGGDADPEAGYRVIAMPGAAAAPTGLGSEADVASVMGDYARFLSDAWGEDPPDVVSAASWIHGVAAQLAADRHQIPAVQCLPELGHALQQRQGRRVGPPPRPRFERLIARSAARVLVSCTEDVSELVALGCARRRLSVLPQAIDVGQFAAVGPAVERTAEQRIVAVARELLPHKGLEDVVRALTRLPAAELVVVGGPDRHRLDWDPGACRLRSLALELNVSDRVHLTGRVAREDLPSILRSADVFVAPSWYESFGLPVVEAMSCGLPVVASASGGMLDTVVHEVTGVLVPARDPTRLAKALDEVLRAGPLRSGMGLAGRVRARSRYCWDRVAAEAATAYEMAVEGVRPRDAGRAAAVPARGDVA
ncbi:glycosyltransferase [Mycolicibacterium sp. P1-18]|uniref:glycosyltransferase n=1 Tax=Mycolicibacterium sp. P1-18 TaxID=2024615 RepID=UPI0011F16C43|nr:glycosyltransferase [Mycolicibacterium sp. P1-18]KAA0101884.1 glycosyltransferase [Mycolicibacterium sp. P1-18]